MIFLEGEADVHMSSTVLLVLYMRSIVQCTYDYSSMSVIVLPPILCVNNHEDNIIKPQ